MSAVLQITDTPYRASMSTVPDLPPKNTFSGNASPFLAPPRRACAFVFIENLPQLAQVYGPDFATSVSREIRRRLCARFLTSVKTDLACLRDDCFLLWSNDSFARDDCSEAERSTSEQLETLLANLGSEPIRAKGIAALVQLHVNWIDVRTPDRMGDAEVDLTLWTAQPFPDLYDKPTDGSGQLYRADMDIAVRLSEALRAERLALEWRPVIDAYASASTLYWEARPYIPRQPDESASLTPDVFLPCLQRLGLTRAFDRLVAQQVVDALRQQPLLHLGVRLFAQSARVDHWWASLLSILQSAPELASRLTVEIPDGMAFSNLQSVRNFCARLQSFGCRIAIKDFGSGRGNLAAAQACRPDIIKLDASFLRRARESELGGECLRDMLALCGHLAAHVVVDGVEREDDLGVALDAGVQWVQGHHLRGTEELSGLGLEMNSWLRTG
ncbi:EAL domain-containing protein (putative c-di-GMP-specific phosphodiesterase class I) [Variovorax boronicumulans]|uniref:EAL domain-containing protein (Putative c-di-GMP-specific phosphodiesterase class I) n=1 Tax=Variovorax boronicumulans TaxID=436515 RepID=A0AAW8CX97_9BURK|nr:EAL domain-containing protein [Variovorax boronicumulans]MDP9894862.1 EAL domain-containing protein (putative c-di-GMP-specific phosphodiesterase class I) [Variovorax boronicumulans]MDQ0054818.1 EAL domain-containing protein (putative c-di-GMP-specific phosphodiesterase class I) [Variovorax boronicumulans]